MPRKHRVIPGLRIGVSLVWALLATAAQCGETLAAVTSSDGRLEIFQTGFNGGLWHNYMSSSGPFLGVVNWVGKRHEFLADVPDVVVGKDPLGRLYVAGINEGHIKLMAQSFPGSEFNIQNTLDTHGLHGLQVATNADGRIEFFALSDEGSAWSVAQTGTDSWNFANRFLGNVALKQLSPVEHKEGRLGLIALETNGRVWWRSQIVPNGYWGEWISLGAEDLALKQLVAADDTDGTVEVFGLREDGSLFRNTQGTSGNWNGWVSIGPQKLKGPMFLAHNEDGRLELFARDPNDIVVHSWQISPTGPWRDGFEALEAYGTSAYDEATDLAATTRYGRLVLVVEVRRPIDYRRLRIAHQEVPNGRFVGFSTIKMNY